MRYKQQDFIAYEEHHQEDVIAESNMLLLRLLLSPCWFHARALALSFPNSPHMVLLRSLSLLSSLLFPKPHPCHAEVYVALVARPRPGWRLSRTLRGHGGKRRRVPHRVGRRLEASLGRIVELRAREPPCAVGRGRQVVGSSSTLLLRGCQSPGFRRSTRRQRLGASYLAKLALCALIANFGYMLDVTIEFGYVCVQTLRCVGRLIQSSVCADVEIALAK